jgi:hypothetical protein
VIWQGRLAGLTSEFNATAQSASRLLGSLMNRGKGPTTLESPDAVAQSAAETIAAPRKSARRSDLPPSLQKQSGLSSSMQKAREQQQELTAAAAEAAASVQEPVQASRAGQEQPQRGRAVSERPKAVRRKLSKKSIEKPEAVPAAASGLQCSCMTRIENVLPCHMRSFHAQRYISSVLKP